MQRKTDNACPLEYADSEFEPCAAIKRLAGAQVSAFGRHVDALHDLGGLGPVLEWDVPDPDKTDHGSGWLPFFNVFDLILPRAVTVSCLVDLADLSGTGEQEGPMLQPRRMR